jgi:hypothetical protein
MMSPETAMRQAKETVYWYFKDAVSVVEEMYPSASSETKAIAASNLSIAASLDYLAAELGGRIEGSNEDFAKSHRAQR